MTYDSPKTIRRRRQRAEDRPARRSRKTKSEIEQQRAWESRRDYHLSGLREDVDKGYCDAAGRHARALFHGLMQLRATEIMRERRCDYLTAEPIAREETYNCEVAR